MDFPAGGKNQQLPSMLDSDDLGTFPALQTVMLVDQMLMTPFLGIGDFGFPATSLHDLLGSENGILKMILTVDVGGIFNQMGVGDDPPVVTIAYTGDVPGSVVHGTGYELTKFYGSRHDGPP
jgi:hypothetical protein